ncbi:hypothetical protein D6D01_09099 [Aureobasidium pullulans]|uniref:SRR1-like domain-containing protein n=1 Tax=Aureobasidium pullulans TaxID=5580 RepID=A0A4S9K6C2_AURPU|nr:hypothetical protein D6D01_09099 [Aureobasidium pullulans]
MRASWISDRIAWKSGQSVFPSSLPESGRTKEQVSSVNGKKDGFTSLRYVKSFAASNRDTYTDAVKSDETSLDMKILLVGLSLKAERLSSRPILTPSGANVDPNTEQSLASAKKISCYNTNMDYKRPSHWAKLPPAPTNPFPREITNSWAGIYLEDWKKALRDFLGKYPEFREEGHDAAGRPGYHWQWRSVMARKKEIMTHTQPDRQEFRASLQCIVDKTDHVDTAVCLALGKFENVELSEEEAFQHQLAMFLVLCEMLEIKQNTKIKTIFQDPRFEPPEEYVITLAGGEIIKHPGALEHMTERSSLYIGNKVESGGGMGIPIAERYVRQFYVTGKRELGPDLQEIIDQMKKFADSYDNYLFDATYDSLHTKYGSHFQNIWVHHPKRRQHDSDNNPPGGSSAAPGPSNPGPKDDSDHGPKGKGGPGFDQSSLPNRNKTDAIQGRWQP